MNSVVDSVLSLFFTNVVKGKREGILIFQISYIKSTRVTSLNFYKWRRGKKERKYDVTNSDDDSDLPIIFTNGVKENGKELRSTRVTSLNFNKWIRGEKREGTLIS